MPDIDTAELKFHLNPRWRWLPAGLAACLLAMPEFFPSWALVPAQLSLLTGMTWYYRKPLLADRRLFLIWALLLPSLLATFRPSLSRAGIEDYGYFCLGILAYLAVSRSPCPKAANGAAATALVGAVFLLSVLGPLITDFRLPSKFFAVGWLRTGLIETGQTLDVNVLAAVIAMAIPLALALLWTQLRRRSRLKSGLLALVLVWFSLLLIVTQSRASWFGVAVGIAVLLSSHSNQAGRFIAIIAVWILSLLVWIGPTDLLRQLSAVGPIPTLDIRLDLWDRTLHAIQMGPLRGFGPGAFGESLQNLPSELAFPGDTPVHCHNLFLQIAFDFGIPALLAFLVLVGSTLRTALANIGRDPILVGFVSSVIVFLMNGLLDSPIWLNKPHWLPFLLLGLLDSNCRTITSKDRGTDPTTEPSTTRFPLPTAVAGWIALCIGLTILTEFQPIVGLVLTGAAGIRLGLFGGRHPESG